MTIEDRIFQLLQEISFNDALHMKARSWFNTNFQAAPRNNDFFLFLQQRITGTVLTPEENQRLMGIFEWQQVDVKPLVALPQQTSPQSPNAVSLSTILDDIAIYLAGCQSHTRVQVLFGLFSWH